MATDALYHNCAYCRYFCNGFCTINVSRKNENSSMYKLCEDGVLHAALSAALDETDTQGMIDTMQNMLKRYGVSDKRIREFMYEFDEWMGQYKLDSSERLCDSVMSTFNIGPDIIEEDNMYISDPYNFYCSKFE